MKDRGLTNNQHNQSRMNPTTNCCHCLNSVYCSVQVSESRPCWQRGQLRSCWSCLPLQHLGSVYMLDLTSFGCPCCPFHIPHTFVAAFKNVDNRLDLRVPWGAVAQRIFRIAICKLRATLGKTVRVKKTIALGQRGRVSPSACCLRMPASVCLKLRLSASVRVSLCTSPPVCVWQPLFVFPCRRRPSCCACCPAGARRFFKFVCSTEGVWQKTPESV